MDKIVAHRLQSTIDRVPVLRSNYIYVVTIDRVSLKKQIATQ